MSRIMDWFVRPQELTGYVYDADIHNGWGDSLSWFNYDERRISGHLRRKPKVGDEILFKMESGKKARFAVIEVEYCGDPADMFFGYVTDIGYVDEPALNKKIREAKERQIEPKQKGLLFL